MTREAPLRIVVIAPLRYPIAEPLAGGLESALWHHVGALRSRGHQVTLCAVRGSDFMDGAPPELHMPEVSWPEGTVASDTEYPPGYLDVAFDALEGALSWIRRNASQFDLLDNHCLHGLPLSWAPKIGLPMVTTLHTPVLPDIVESLTAAPHSRSTFVAVSGHTARQWAEVGVESTVIPNAIEPARWRRGRGGDDLVWFGRIVPEKGVHLAIDAAERVGRRLVIAGRVGDPDYAASQVWSRLGDRVTYAGALGQAEVAALVGGSACALVTPVWDEPFGLVIPEALATGTPVAAFATGGIAEVVAGSPGAALAARGNVAALARAVERLVSDSTAATRQATRAHAIRSFSLQTRVTRLEALYRRSLGESVTEDLGLSMMLGAAS